MIKYVKYNYAAHRVFDSLVLWNEGCIDWFHYQFESIHPFYDGNGRTDRIVNVLHLILKDLLDSSILYLSHYIIRNKTAYYRLLQEVRTDKNWEDWIVYILTGIEETAEDTLTLVKRINTEVDAMTAEIK